MTKKQLSAWFLMRGYGTKYSGHTRTMYVHSLTCCPKIGEEKLIIPDSTLGITVILQ